jgi:hypothetical protein
VPPAAPLGGAPGPDWAPGGDPPGGEDLPRRIIRAASRATTITTITTAIAIHSHDPPGSPLLDELELEPLVVPWAEALGFPVPTEFAASTFTKYVVPEARWVSVAFVAVPAACEVQGPLTVVA